MSSLVMSQLVVDLSITMVDWHVTPTLESFLSMNKWHGALPVPITGIWNKLTSFSSVKVTGRNISPMLCLGQNEIENSTWVAGEVAQLLQHLHAMCMKPINSMSRLGSVSVIYERIRDTLVLRFGMFAQCVYVGRFSECLPTLCQVSNVDFRLFLLYHRPHCAHGKQLVPQVCGQKLTGWKKPFNFSIIQFCEGPEG